MVLVGVRGSGVMGLVEQLVVFCVFLSARALFPWPILCVRT